MIGNQLIDQYARRITDEKQLSVIGGSAAGTEKPYQPLHQHYQAPGALRKLAASGLETRGECDTDQKTDPPHDYCSTFLSLLCNRYFRCEDIPRRRLLLQGRK